MNRLERALCAAVIGILSLTSVSCGIRVMVQGDKRAVNQGKNGWFPRLDPDKLVNGRGVHFIKGLKGYQQTTNYTCGPAVLMEISVYYHQDGVTLDSSTEMRISEEAGTRGFDVIENGGKPGTTPDEMKRWLEAHGFDARIDYEEKGDGSALEQLRDNLVNGIPTIVQWSDFGGHWVIAVGYDTRNNDDPSDDVIIFADSFDRYDDYEDGYTFMNAARFYSMWYDALHFDKLTWRTIITATPLCNDTERK